MRQFICIVFGAVLLTACNALSVRDTSGIQACIAAQARAEVAAVRLKGWSKPGTDAYSQAESAYDAASASVLSFLRGILFEAQLKDVVDVPVSKYESDAAAGQLKHFLDTYGQESGALPSNVVGLLAAAIAGTDSLISLIDRLEKRSRADALDRLERALSVVQPIPFNQVTIEVLTAKYHAVSAAH